MNHLIPLRATAVGVLFLMPGLAQDAAPADPPPPAAAWKLGAIDISGMADG